MNTSPVVQMNLRRIPQELHMKLQRALIDHNAGRRKQGKEALSQERFIVGLIGAALNLNAIDLPEENTK